LGTGGRQPPSSRATATIAVNLAAVLMRGAWRQRIAAMSGFLKRSRKRRMDNGRAEIAFRAAHANAERPAEFPRLVKNAAFSEPDARTRTNCARRGAIVSSENTLRRSKIHRNLFVRFRNFTARDSVCSTGSFPRSRQNSIFRKIPIPAWRVAFPTLGANAMAKKLFRNVSGRRMASASGLDGL
jgi:hypothetical protein